MKQHHRKGPTRLERVPATLLFILALFFHGVYLWGRGDNYWMDAVYHAGPVPHHIAWELGLLCVLIWWWRLPGQKDTSLTAIINGRERTVSLRRFFACVMTAAGALALLSALVCTTPNLKNRFKNGGEALSGPEILSSTQVICHAMGAPDGHDYLNCLEGFEEMYAQGVRVFEVDMLMTADGSVVLRHEWENPFQEGIGPSSIPTKEEFLAQPILGQYTPLSFRDLLLLMEQYPDVCVVTDTKYAAPDIAAAQLHSMLEDAESLGLAALFDRIIIQVYNPDMLDTLDRVYHFPHYIFNLYQFGFEQTEEDFRKKAEFCASRGVQGITMWASLWNPAYAPIAQEYGVEVYVHTVNDLGEARELLNTGVSAVYTDTLTDALLTEGS